MKLTTAIGILVLVGWAMVAQPAEQADVATAQTIVELKGLVCNRGQFGIFLPTSLQGYEALGIPTSEKSGPAGYGALEEISHNWHTFEYPGLTVHAVAALKEPHESFVEAVEVSDARWNKYFGIKIGAPIADILSRTTRKNISMTSPLMFCGYLIGAPDCANVHFKNGLISKVEYQCFTG